MKTNKIPQTYGFVPSIDVTGLGDKFGRECTPNKKVVYLSVLKNPAQGWLGMAEMPVAHFLGMDDRQIIISGSDIEYRCVQADGAPDWQCSRDETAWLCVQHAEGNYRVVIVNVSSKSDDDES
jgi:hypothetical protein